MITAKASQEKRRIQVEIANRRWVGPMRSGSPYAPYVEVPLGALGGGSYELVIFEQMAETGETTDAVLGPHHQSEQVFEVQGPEGADECRALEARVERGPMPLRVLLGESDDKSTHRVGDKLRARIRLDPVGAGDQVTAEADLVDQTIHVRIESVRHKDGAGRETWKIPWVVVRVDAPKAANYHLMVWETVRELGELELPEDALEREASIQFSVVGELEGVGP